MKNYILYFLVIITFTSGSKLQAKSSMTTADLGSNGEIPFYLVAGPIPANLEGFGTLVLDKELDGVALNPVIGQKIKTPLLYSGHTQWSPQSIDSEGFLDFHPPFTWQSPGSDPERIWHGHSAYAVVTLISEKAQELNLLCGTASQAQLFLNGAEVWKNNVLRGAVEDSDKLTLSLKAGSNQLCFQIYQSHHNYGLSFFGGTPWQWGLYARLTTPEGKPASGVQAGISGDLGKNKFNVNSTPFFKNADNGELLQQIYVSIQLQKAATNASFSLGDLKPVQFDDLSLGANYRSIWVPSIEDGGKIKAILTLGDTKVKQSIKIKPQRRWEIFYMPLSHQDIGYTHTQPITGEISSKNLEDVLDYMKEDPEFKWTVETLWQLEQMLIRQGQGRQEEFFQRVKEGRISLSPGWTNSFGGQLSEEEAIRSMEPAIQWAAKEGVDFPAYVFNDTPGASWFWPGLLEGMGVDFFFAGINEVYNDYTLQRKLPKLFRWQGGDGGEVITYLGETYNEGLVHGFEKGPEAMVMLIANQLGRLENDDWPYKHVGLSVSYLDNGGIPTTQIANIKAWNKLYAWPKILFSTTGDYAKQLKSENLEKLPVFKGDWTSPWETRSQGEPARMLLQREAQATASSAEKLNVISWLEGRLDQPDEATIQKIYQSLQEFSGHGSGLEAGYGNREDNILADSYRQQYVSTAWHDSRALVEREMYRLIYETFSFAGQGVLVFNPSSFSRSEVVQVSFGRMPAKPLEVVDPRSGEVLPSAWKDDETLIFVAHDMVGLGHTKFVLRSEGDNSVDSKASITWDPSNRRVENDYYTIEYASDGSGHLIESLYSKTLKKHVFSPGSGLDPLAIVTRKPFMDESFDALSFPNSKVEIIDLRPVGIVLSVKAHGQIAEGLEIGIWSGLSVLDVKATINLEELSPPESLEEIGLAFPQVKSLGNIWAELAGGWIDPDKSLLPGVTKEALSLRQGILLEQKKYSLAVASRDARVLFLESNKKGNVLPVLNLVNNFPTAWNRNEANKGSLDFRVRLEVLKSGSKPGDAAGLAVATAEPLFVKDSWLAPDDPDKSSFSVKGEGLSIISMKRSRDGDALIIRVKNSAVSGKGTGIITSAYFGPETKIYASNILENKAKALIRSGSDFKLNLGPSQIQTIRVEEFIRNGRSD